jgi:hypothetical protein
VIFFKIKKIANSWPASIDDALVLVKTGTGNMNLI